MAPHHAPDLLRTLVEGTAAATGDDFFRSLARHAARALGARYAFAAETLNPMESRSLAYWEGEGFGQGFSYRFPGTPCQRVAEGFVCFTKENLFRKYPEDKWLETIGAESYVGVPMRNAAGKVLGHIAVLHTAPMEPSPEDIDLLQIFAARACAELERVQADRALQAALAELRRLRDQLQAQNVALQEELRVNHHVGEIVGSDPALLALLAAVERVADSEATVLIQGETGTGKELVARALHDRSPRRDRPLLKVNCGAISAGLVESELFGHAKGAFTGAAASRAGRFELADGGTIFLDEVGELPADTQVKLLRVLQEREFEPVGSNQTVRVDVRVLAATNRDLQQAVREGTFRADLYYRLHVIPLRVPPLRERRSDVARLALFFLERSARKSGRPARAISSDTLERLAAYDWPGNVRELQNVIERAVVLSAGPVLEIDPAVLRNPPAPAAPAPAAPAPAAQGTPNAVDETGLEQMERRHIVSVLERAAWVVEGPKGAAQLLDMNPSTLRSRMKKLGIARSP
jgi:formate hydrogenlyase transcriptional activator